MDNQLKKEYTFHDNGRVFEEYFINENNEIVEDFFEYDINQNISKTAFYVNGKPHGEEDTESSKAQKEREQGVLILTYNQVIDFKKP